MSRSKRKPFYVCTSKVDKDIVHGQVRAKIRAELQKDEPNYVVLESTIRDFGLEDLETVIGFDYLGDLLDEEQAEWEEEEKRCARK